MFVYFTPIKNSDVKIIGIGTDEFSLLEYLMKLRSA
jgi:hypothetical protein